MDKRKIVIMATCVLLILTLPILVNILLSLNWFSNFVVGEETV